jgi:hypothetical protein
MTSSRGALVVTVVGLAAFASGPALADPARPVQPSVEPAAPSPPPAPETPPPNPPGDRARALPAGPPKGPPWSVGVTDAEKARATELLARGNELLVQNRHAAALEQYRLAIRVWDHPAIRANMVVCLINLGRPLEAYESALLALVYGPAPLDKPEVYAETLNYRKLLEGQIATLQLSCTGSGARVTLDGQDLLACPGRSTRRLLAGRHQLVARGRGYLSITRDFTAVGGASESIDLSLVRLEDAAHTERPWAAWKPWAVTGGGAGLVLAGGLLQLKADADMDRHDADLERLCGDDGCAGRDVPRSLSNLKSRAELENKIAIGTVITGGAVAVTGLVLVYLNRPRTVLPDEAVAGIAVAPMVTADAAGLSFGGIF